MYRTHTHDTLTLSSAPFFCPKIYTVINIGRDCDCPPPLYFIEIPDTGVHTLYFIEPRVYLLIMHFGFARNILLWQEAAGRQGGRRALPNAQKR